ncbi:MAG: PD-(D/E)XK nuclease family protein [Chloroflexi bacterium]|nr:PD-(D/E)XK nuclease family protein [Chloroflexota bacterium]
MSRLLLAPAGYGKTERIIRSVRQVLAEEPLAPVVAIVPNSIQAGGFRKRLSASGGALGVEVHTFHTLYAELLTRAGQPLPLLLDPVRIRLLRFIVDDLCERGEMTHYAALRAKPGFIAGLRNTIEELKRARVFPDLFADSVKGLGARLEEIARVYAAYQDWLQKQNWADNEGRGWLAAIALESNPTLGADTRLLAVSGFDEFNPTQLAVLSHLAHRAKETLITLTSDLQNPHRPAHHRFHRAQQAITSALGIQPEAMESTSMLSVRVANMEASLFQPASTTNPSLRGVSRASDEAISSTEGGLLRREEHPPRNDAGREGGLLPEGRNEVEFIEAHTRAVEARAALRWAKARVVRDGMKLSDVAILARDLEPYRPFLEETAAEFGIPLRIVGGQPLNENPAVAALLSLLSLPAEDWPRRMLVESWRSPYFDWTWLGITPESAATLDEISRVGRVIQGLSQWREAFELWKKRKITEFEEDLPSGDSDSKVSRLSSLQSLEALESAFNSFVDLLTPPNRASVKEFVAFVESIIGNDPALSPLPLGEGSGVRVVERARENDSTKERDIAALRAFKDVLRGLVLAESVLGADTIPYADFYKDLRGAVDAATFSVPAESGVFIVSALDGRGLSFEAVVLMGLSEGEFPKQEREDIFLRESDRATLRERGLPLETKLHGDEATFFYQAVTRGRQRLLLTRPYLAEDGQAWEASPFWAEVTRLNGDQPKRQVRGVVGEVEAAEAASRVEWVESARAFDIQIKNGIEVLKARMSPKAKGIYEGELFDLSERFNADLGWSASRLESYGTCPFEFFVAYALGLEPREEAEEGFDVRMLGSMWHKILEMVYGGAELRDAAAKVFASAPADYGFRPTALWELQQKEFVRMLEKTIRALDEASQGYTPKQMEARFGMGNPSLVVKTSAGDVRLHGYIDRLDVADDGSLRVIDYKAGSTAITANHLKEGRRLQLPIYAMAARDALGLGEISGGFYWHIQKAEASSLKLEKFEGGVGAAFEMAVKHIGDHVAGIRTGHFEPHPPEEGCPSYCPATNFCWRYKRGF